MLFPLITFPYAARIIMADGIGQINFFSSIISYISLFTCLGIPMYAIRETAKVRDDQTTLSKTTTEILLLHISLTLVGYIAVFIIAFTVPKVMADIPLFLLLSTSIFFTAIGCEWFYQGVEDFKYITIRAITIRSLCVVLLFLLVKTKDDLHYYAIYSVIGSVGNNIFNFCRLRKHITLRLIICNELRPLRHLKPVLNIFVLNLIVSIYINLDKVMLGLLTTNTSVGYYVGATQMTGLLMRIVSSLSTVMIPRLSYLINNNQMKEFKRIAQFSIDFVIAICIPLSLGLYITAPNVINLLCGPSYAPAIQTLQILSPILIFIAISNVLGIQILYPQGKESIVIKCTVVGAVVNVTLNVCLIPFLENNGAAIASCIAEFMVTLVMIIISHKYIPINYSINRYSNYIIAGILMSATLLTIHSITTFSNLFSLIIYTILGVIIYFGYLYMRKDTLFMSLITSQKRQTILTKQ